MIVDSLVSVGASDNVDVMTDRYLAMVYAFDRRLIDHIQTLMLPGKTTFLFSGSWRLDFAAAYIELRCYKKCKIAWHADTLFLEPRQPDLYHYTLQKLKQTNLVILHSDYWCGHRKIEYLLNDLEELKYHAEKVICTLPINHANFNKLTTSVSDLCEQYSGISLWQDCLVLTR